jgi:hypothetical protein
VRLSQKQNTNKRKDQRVWLSGSVLASHVWGPEFNAQYYKKKQKKFQFFYFKWWSEGQAYLKFKQFSIVIKTYN